jgi:hypothetical protein
MGRNMRTLCLLLLSSCACVGQPWTFLDPAFVCQTNASIATIRETNTIGFYSSNVVSTYIYQYVPDQQNGGASEVVTRTGTYGRQPLFKFTLTSIPTNATLVSAKLSLISLTTAPADLTYNLYRILIANSGWVETNSNWNYANTNGSVRWAGDVGSNGGSDAGCSISGTDYSSTVMGTLFIANGGGNNVTNDISLDATEFNLMIANNAGIIILGGPATTTYNFTGRGYSTVSSRPRMTVVYTYPQP